MGRVMVAALLAALLPAMAAGRESPEEPLIRGAALNDSHSTASPSTSPSHQQQQQQPDDGDGSGPSADGGDRLIEYLPFEDLELGVGSDREREGSGAADGSHRLLAARILNVHYDDIANDPDKRQSFFKSFKEVASKALEVPRWAVVIQGIFRGSLIVLFDVFDEGSSADDDKLLRAWEEVVRQTDQHPKHAPFTFDRFFPTSFFWPRDKQEILNWATRHTDGDTGSKHSHEDCDCSDRMLFPVWVWPLVAAMVLTCAGMVVSALILRGREPTMSRTTTRPSVVQRKPARPARPCAIPTPASTDQTSTCPSTGAKKNRHYGSGKPASAPIVYDFKDGLVRYTGGAGGGRQDILFLPSYVALRPSTQQRPSPSSNQHYCRDAAALARLASGIGHHHSCPLQIPDASRPVGMRRAASTHDLGTLKHSHHAYFKSNLDQAGATSPARPAFVFTPSPHDDDQPDQPADVKDSSEELVLYPPSLMEPPRDLEPCPSEPPRIPRSSKLILPHHNTHWARY